MSDIVERLRAPAPLHWEAKEAADEITALRAENEKLRAALEMFACDCEGKAICLGNCAHRNARAALGEKQ